MFYSLAIPFKERTMVRMHDQEMYLVSVSHRDHGHGEEVAMLCLTDDLEVALNTARTAEKFGFNISRPDDGAFIWAFTLGHADEKRAPIFERRWNYEKVTDKKKDWVEKWGSFGHMSLLDKFLKEPYSKKKPARARSRR